MSALTSAFPSTPEQVATLFNEVEHKMRLMQHEIDMLRAENARMKEQYPVLVDPDLDKQAVRERRLAKVLGQDVSSLRWQVTSVRVGAVSRKEILTRGTSSEQMRAAIDVVRALIDLPPLGFKFNEKEELVEDPTLWSQAASIASHGVSAVSLAISS